ncbi:hypothetical protein KR200_007337, partial [Drosophila serrata]
PKTLTEADVLNIYNDCSKVADIERYLKLLFRPFVCFLNTKCQYNLRKLRHCLPDSTYDPDRHMALVTTYRRPCGVIKIYANGNMLCQALNQYDSYKVLVNFSEALAELNDCTPSLIKPKFNLVNATFCMPFPLDLQALKERIGPNATYTPTEHPFLTYIEPRTLIKYIIFPMGYVYVMLCTGMHETRMAIVHVLPILYSCRAPTQQNQTDLELTQGDINFKLLWETEFQKDQHFATQW